jgi:uncharacterized membrane protein YhaH (DUF805 family)
MMRAIEESPGGTKPRRRSLGMELLDASLVVVGVVVGVMLLLAMVHAVVGIVAFLFKLAVLIVVVAIVVRLFHHARHR